MRGIHFNRKRILYGLSFIAIVLLFYVMNSGKEDFPHPDEIEDVITNKENHVNRRFNFPTKKLKPDEAPNPTEDVNTTAYPPKLLAFKIPDLSSEESSGPGEGGKPYSIKQELLSAAEKIEFEQGMQNNAFNQFASDRISVRRYLKDTRPQGCRDLILENDLPKTSIIICFHNEAWSALVRSLHSIIDRSDPKLVEEIILVDDASTMDHLKQPLDDYIEDLGIVKVLRLKDRHGLIRARLVGAGAAKAKVLTFLDSHIECMPGWLEPLLSPIKQDSRNVVAPVIISISDENLSIANVNPNDVQVGGFTWSLVFTWHFPPKELREREGAPFSPLPTPTIAGGLFAIDAEFFKTLGYYDPGFEVWGAENLEISFKTWMCHGNLYVIPCSQVGHIFRNRSPYQWDSKFINPLKRNNDRLAEVWLDDFKKFYFERTGNKLADIGDISSRVKLRQDLQCHSFQWYLDNVYPNIFNPNTAIIHGRIRNPKTNMCIDSGGRRSKNIIAYTCHNGGGNQLKKGLAYKAWYLTKTGEIRQDEKCFDANAKPGELVTYPCHGMEGFQKFSYTETGSVIESARGCIELSGDRLLFKPCRPDNPKQLWIWESLVKY